MKDEKNSKALQERYDTVIAELKKKRQLLGLKTEDVAERCGVMCKKIELLERGYDVKISLFINYFNALGLKFPFKIDEFGENLKGKRQSLKISQWEIAEKCCVSGSSISLIEKGREQLNAKVLLGYMDVVGIDLPFDAISPKEAEKQKMELAKKIDLELLKIIASKPKEKQKKLLEFIQIFN